MTRGAKDRRRKSMSTGKKKWLKRIRWSSDDTLRLLLMIAGNQSWEHAALMLSRTPRACRYRFMKIRNELRKPTIDSKD